MISKVKKNQIGILWLAGFNTDKVSEFRNPFFVPTNKQSFKGLTLLLFIIMMGFGNNLFANNYIEINLERGFNIEVAAPISDTIVFFDTVYSYDTLFTYQTVYDTVFFYDTVYVEQAKQIRSKYIDSLSQILHDNKYLKKPKQIIVVDFLKEKISKWSIDGHYSFFTLNHNFESDDTSSFDLLEKRKSSFSSDIGYSIGADVNYHFSKNLYLQSGVSFSQFYENLDFQSEKTIIDTIYIPNIQTISLPEIDTIYFLNIDSLVFGDTSWIQHFDTTMVDIIDTFYTENHETRIVENKRKETNSWQYFEIPILASWQYKLGAFNLGIKSGAITGFLIKHKRYQIYNGDNIFTSKIEESKELEQINVSLYFSAVAEYQIAENWSFTFEPWIKTPLMQFSKSENINLKIRSQGVRFGVRYYL